MSEQIFLVRAEYELADEWILDRKPHDISCKWGQLWIQWTEDGEWEKVPESKKCHDASDHDFKRPDAITCQKWEGEIYYDPEEDIVTPSDTTRDE